MGERSDLNMVERALRQEWGVSQDVLAKVIDRCAEILNDEDASDRLKISASKVVVQAHKNNLENEKHLAQQVRLERGESTGDPVVDMNELLKKINDSIGG